ncbi:MAG: ABC transporter ATP-binding protein [Bacteroidales bacterium]|jgi:putative ABC transport system ATP-binding protein|nr:ABC transporter ATP-binding protein [Bacteroidales bacterium]MCI1733173.1 ABC transporter ATP-binding protein [Bacteroidales bacterium]
MDTNKSTEREEVKEKARGEGREEVIKIDNLFKIYQIGNQEVCALDGVSLSIYKNDFVAIMGPSGSGKSTMMNILGCLDTPTSGRYVLNGTDVSKMNDGQLADVRNKEIGFVFQSFNLLPKYSSLENVALPMIYAGIPREERLEHARKSLDIVGLADRMEHKPSELSGGQRQRVAIARAIINNPTIILADEPTGNLDTKTSVEIMKIFEKIYRAGNTIILVTHEEDIAKFARRIVKLRDGKIESDLANPHPVMESQSAENKISA